MYKVQRAATTHCHSTPMPSTIPLDRLGRLLVSSSSSSSKSSSLAKICRTVVCYQRIVIEITEHLRRMQYSLWRRRRRRRRALTSSSSSSSSSLVTDPTPPPNDQTTKSNHLPRISRQITKRHHRNCRCCRRLGVNWSAHP
jgi:hypothetical protein